MRKRSTCITLVLLGAAATLAGCGQSFDEEDQQDTVEVKQDLYSSLQDCQADWGKNSEDCKPAAQSAAASSSSTYAPHGATGGGYHYLGPRYYWDRDNMVPRSYDNPQRAYPSSFAAAHPPESVSTAGKAAGASSHSIGRVSSIARGGFAVGAHGGTSGG